MIQHIRIARPTERLNEVVAFYKEIFGFELVSGFEDHAGFDGAMLGHSAYGFHLEFTHERGVTVAATPSEEHLLVFYFREAGWHRILERLREHRVPTVASHNPYWDEHGVTVLDPDGQRIVVHRGPWSVGAV